MDRRLTPALGFVALVALLVAAVVLGSCQPTEIGLLPTPARSIVPVASGPSAAALAGSAETSPSVPPGAALTPSASGLALNPPPTTGPFEMDLYRKGDFTTEKRPIWCAPAALQTMINVMSPGADTSRATQ